MAASRSGHWTTITRSQVSGGTVVARWWSADREVTEPAPGVRALPDVDQAASAHVHAVHDVLGDRGNVRPGRREALGPPCKRTRTRSCQALTSSGVARAASIALRHWRKTSSAASATMLPILPSSAGSRHKFPLAESRISRNPLAGLARRVVLASPAGGMAASARRTIFGRDPFCCLCCRITWHECAVVRREMDTFH